MLRRPVSVHLQHDLLSQPAPVFPGPTGVRAQFAFEHHHRRHRLNGLGRHPPDSAGERRSGQPVHARPGAHSSGREKGVGEHPAFPISPPELRDPQPGGPVGNHPLGDDFGQRAEHRLRKEVANQMTCAYRAGELCVQNTPLRRPDRHRPETPLVVGHSRADCALEGICRIRVGIIVNHVDPPIHLRRGPGVVHRQRVLPDRHRNPDRQRVVEPVDLHLIFVRPVRDLGNGRPRGRLRAGQDEIGHGFQISQAVFRHHLDQLGRAHVVAGLLRVDIPHHLVRHPHVRPYDLDQILVHPAFPEQLHNRNMKPFLVDLPRVRAQRPSANIHCVARVGEPTDASPLVEHRRHHRNIVQMPRRQPGVVRQQAVPRSQRLNWIAPYKIPHAVGHRIDVPGRARHRLRQHIPGHVEGTGGQIPGLAHHGCERCVHQRRSLLVHN